MRSTTIFAIIALFGTLSMIAAKEQAMPFAFHSKDKALNFDEDLFATKEQLLNKFAASVSTKNLENGLKAIVINIRTPSSVAGTIEKIKEFAKYLPHFSKLVQTYFRNQVVYDSVNFIQELQNTLNKHNIIVEINSEVKPKQVSIQETNVQLDDIAQLEQTIENAQKEDASVFIIFSEQAASNSQKPRVLQNAGDTTTTPSMVQIPSQTLFGLILLFTLFIPVLWIGISCLYGIETPEKFASQNYVVGKEY